MSYVNKAIAFCDKPSARSAPSKRVFVQMFRFCIVAIECMSIKELTSHLVSKICFKQQLEGLFVITHPECLSNLLKPPE